MNASWKKQLDEHRDKRKEEIIAAAEAVFMEQELAKVTTKDIVERCGISRVTLYKYFKSMDEIIFEVQIRILEQFREDMTSIVPETLSGFMKFKAMFDHMLNHFEEYKQRNRFIGMFDFNFRDSYPTPELEQRYRQFLKQSKAPFHAWLKEGQEDGSIRKDISIEVGTAMISNVMNATIQRIAIRGDILHQDQGVMPSLVLCEMASMLLIYLHPNGTYEQIESTL